MNSGQVVTAPCSVVEGDHPLRLRWLFNEEPVDPRSGITVFNIGERSAILSIGSVAHDHAGNYTCIAENEAGVDSHTASLIINGTDTGSVHLILSLFVSFDYVRFVSSRSSTSTPRTPSRHLTDHIRLARSHRHRHVDEYSQIACTMNMKIGDIVSEHRTDYIAPSRRVRRRELRRAEHSRTRRLRFVYDRHRLSTSSCLGRQRDRRVTLAGYLADVEPSPRTVSTTRPLSLYFY